MKNIKGLLTAVCIVVSLHAFAQTNLFTAPQPIYVCPTSTDISFTYVGDSHPYTDLDWSVSGNGTIKSGSPSGTMHKDCILRFSGDATITVTLQLTAGGTLDEVYNVYARSVGTTQVSSSLVCPSTSVTLSSAGAVGELTWQSRPTGGSTWTTIAGPTSSSVNTTVTAATDYRAQTGCAGPGNSSPMMVNVYSATTAGSIGSDATICSGSSPGTLSQTAAATGGSIAYQWQKYISGSWTNIGGATSTTYAPGTLTNAGPSQATHQYRRVATGCSGPAVNTNTVTITVDAPASGGSVSTTPTSICTSGTVSVTSSGYVATTMQWQYRYSDNGGSSWAIGWTNFSTTVSGSQTSPPLVSNGANDRLYQFQVLATNGTCGSTATSNTVSATVYPSVPGTVSPASQDVIGVATGSVTLGGLGSYLGNIQRWEQYSGGVWTNISSGTPTQYYSNLSSTTKYRALVSNGGCTGSYSTEGIINIYPTPTISTDIEFLAYGTSANLTSTGSGFTGYKWIRNGTDISTANSSTYTATLPGDYQLRVTAGSTTYTTGILRIQSLLFLNKSLRIDNTTHPAAAYNIASVTRIRKAGVSSSTDLFTLLPTELTQGVVYTDGVGRPYQQIAIGQSPNGKDVISARAYAANGSYAGADYLPYVADEKLGYYRSDAIRKNGSSYLLSEQRQFYNGAAHAVAVAQDTVPYSSAVFSKSMTGRVREQAAPGVAWKVGSGHTTKSDMIMNTASDSVRIWKPDLTTTAMYAANLLIVSQVKDENGNRVKTFSDKAGKLILKKVLRDSTSASSMVWLNTYFIYDIYDRLICQVPPKALSVLGPALSLNAASSTISELVFRYIYDERGRLTEKKVPGAAVQYMVYDKYDRLVHVQDGNLRATNKWLSIKYDGKGRVIMTGFKIKTAASQAAMRTYVEGKYGSGPYFEARGSGLQGYTNSYYPVLNADSVLTINYYDNYDLDNSGSDDASYVPQGLIDESGQSQGSAFGLPSASKRRIMGTGDFLATYIFYDQFGRAIQTRSNNHLRLTTDNLVTMVYDFTGKVMQTKSEITTAANNPVVTLNTITYDHAGRLLKVTQKINTDTEQIIAAYRYNEVGQVIEKKLHMANDSDLGMQSVDYRFNIRGWLSSINNAGLSNDGVANDDTNDYFGMELLYNQVDTPLGNTAMFNGNISAMKWQGPGGDASDLEKRSYKYTYDKSDQLKQATFQMSAGAAWTAEANTLDEQIAYDLNGNILTLNRKRNSSGLSGLNFTSTPQVMDNLVYTYTTGNQLSKVEDSALSAGFVNGKINGTNEYTYGVAGNLTADANKGISEIKYNELGKVLQVLYADGRKQDYIYAADGSKLAMKTYANTGMLLLQTDDVGPLQFENGELKYLPTPEGRVARTGKSVLDIARTSCNATTGFIAQNSTLSALITGGETYLKVVSATGSAPGVGIVNGISVQAGKKYLFRVKGYVQLSSTYQPVFYVNSNAGSVVWSATSPALPTGPANEGWVNYEFTAPTGATTVDLGVYWWSGYSITTGTEFYLNEIEFKPVVNEYQYVIKDHQGNTRLMFSSVQGAPVPSTADMEASTNTAFPNYGDIYRSNVALYNRTPSGTYSNLLNGGYNGQIGLAKSYKVLPGDKVKIEAYAKFTGNNGAPGNLTGFAAALLAAFQASPSAIGELGTPSYALNQYGAIVGAGSGHSSGGPKAFVNIILFDKNHKFIDAAFKAIDPAAEQVGVSPNVPHSYVAKEYVVKEAGYAYLYVSNENPTLVDVYFDDVTMTYTPGNVIQYNEYYPFGMRTEESWDRVEEKDMPSMHTGLVLKMDFDGGAAADKSGNGFNGTMYNGAVTTTLQGRPEALLLDGTDDYAQVSDNALLDFGAGNFNDRNLGEEACGNAERRQQGSDS